MEHRGTEGFGRAYEALPLAGYWKSRFRGSYGEQFLEPVLNLLPLSSMHSQDWLCQKAFSAARDMKLRRPAVCAAEE